MAKLRIFSIAIVILLNGLQVSSAQDSVCRAYVREAVPNFAYQLAIQYTGEKTLEDVTFMVEAGDFYRMTLITKNGQQITLLPPSGEKIDIEPNTETIVYYENGTARPADSLILHTEADDIPCEIINLVVSPTATQTPTITPSFTNIPPRPNGVNSGPPVIEGNLPDFVVLDVRLMPDYLRTNLGECRISANLWLEIDVTNGGSNYGRNQPFVLLAEAIGGSTLTTTPRITQVVNYLEPNSILRFRVDLVHMGSGGVQVSVDPQNLIREASEENNSVVLDAETAVFNFTPFPPCQPTVTPSITPTLDLTTSPTPSPT